MNAGIKHMVHVIYNKYNNININNFPVETKKMVSRWGCNSEIARRLGRVVCDMHAGVWQDLLFAF